MFTNSSVFKGTLGPWILAPEHVNFRGIFEHRFFVLASRRLGITSRCIGASYKPTRTTCRHTGTTQSNTGTLMRAQEITNSSKILQPWSKNSRTRCTLHKTRLDLFYKLYKLLNIFAFSTRYYTIKRLQQKINK